MSETDVDDQNEPASEEPEKEVQNVDNEEAKEKVVKDKHPSPIPDASIYARASMFNQSVAKKNGQLHRLFLNNRTDECLIIIEQLLEKHSEALCEYALICKARIAQDNGDIKTAIDSLTIALKNNSKSERLLYLLGRARYLQGDHLKAIECFKKSIEFNPTNWRAYYWAARSYYHSETEDDNVNLEKAQETLMSCPKANKSVDILVFLAKICIQKNQLIPAIEAFKRALEIEPENTEIIAELGLLYLKTNSDQKAFSCLGKALTYDPTHVPSILAASTVLQRNNDFDVALTKYRVAIEKCDYNGPLWNNIGMCFYGKGKLIAAISCLKKASYQYPLDCKVLFNLAITHRAMLQFASAYHFISSAVNLQNKNVIFIMTTAMILADLEDFVSARKAYKKAMSIDPGNIVVRLNFAIFEYRRGNIEDAAKLLEPLNPAALGEIEDASDIISRINKLRSCLVQLHKEEQAQ